MFVPNVPSSSFSAHGRPATSLSPQRMIVRQGRQDYSAGMQPQYMQLQSQQQPLYAAPTTGSPLKFQQQVPTYGSPLPMDASKQFGGPPTLVSAATASGEPNQSQPTQAAVTPRGRAKRVVSAGKNLQNLIKGQKIGTQTVTTAADWEGEEYTTRCLCGLAHDDEFMVW